MKTLFCVAVLEYDQECDGYGTINPDLYHFECDDDGSGGVESVIYEKVEKMLEDEGYDLDNYSISVNKVSEIIKL
jgi:hypothetical protein